MFISTSRSITVITAFLAPTVEPFCPSQPSLLPFLSLQQQFALPHAQVGKLAFKPMRMPAAVTPPAVSVKDLSVPKTSYMPTQNLGLLDTKRKIICFSGTFLLICRSPPITLSRSRAAALAKDFASTSARSALLNGK